MVISLHTRSVIRCSESIFGEDKVVTRLSGMTVGGCERKNQRKEIQAAKRWMKKVSDGERYEIGNGWMCCGSVGGKSVGGGWSM